MGNCKDCTQCDCDDGGIIPKNEGENLAESIHHDCCWFARKTGIEICIKNKFEFTQDVHGIMAESCQDCKYYAYAP